MIIVSKVKRWQIGCGDQDTWRRLTLVDKETKTILKAKIYARGIRFFNQDAIECMVKFRINNCATKSKVKIVSNKRIMSWFGTHGK
jgi:hypothetical protein